MAGVKPRGTVADHITIAHRYVRSVDMVRDLTDRRALDGYVVTPSVRDALFRVLQGLALDSTQRAFRVTGPYGSGKSAFGLLLARLVIERATKRGAAFSLARQAGVQEAAASLPSYVPLVLNGRHVRFADALLDALYASANGLLGVSSPAIARDAAALRARSSDTERVLDLIAKYAERVGAARKQRGGVLILADELGRFLEYSALNRATEDVSIFQQLAERAGGASKAPIAVVGFLHHRFADYAAGFGAWAEAEWTRSAERYEDVPLVESTEETAFLLAQALSHTETSLRTTTKVARTVYGEAVRRGVFAAHDALSDAAPRLFPLHASTVACLARFARRFGQNDRSIFGFLQSLEPFGLQRFANATPFDATAWYRLPDLFDYIAAQSSMRPLTADRERRWSLIVDAIRDTGDLHRLDCAILKCIGILAAVEPVVGLATDADSLAWCLGVSKAEVTHALDRLVKRNLLYRRSHRDDFTPWASTSVDLDGWVAEASVRVPPTQRLDVVLASLPPPRPLIAHRHYHTTGTLRAFSVQVWTRTDEPTIASDRRSECDGAIVVVPVYPDEHLADVQAAVQRTLKPADAMTLFCIRRVTPGDLMRARELAIWRWIQTECTELRADDLARREVRMRIKEAEDALAAALQPFASNVMGDANAATWIHRGEMRVLGRSADVSEYLSAICDAVYTSAPILKNELINRSTLSSAAASARMRLLELMAEDSSREYLGLNGAPPERTMYLSVFRSSGMHQQIAPGRWVFNAPDPDPMRWQPVWNAIGAYVAERRACTFDDLLHHLGGPPFGLRAGPALLVIAAFMLRHRDAVAIIERGSFQPELSGAHFQRLAKNPANFGIRYVGQSTEARALAEAFAADLVLWHDRPRPAVGLKPIVEAIYRWWNNLPEFAREAARVSRVTDAVRLALKKASDPVELLFRDLPIACGLEPMSEAPNAEGTRRFMEALNRALAELDGATPALRHGAEAAVFEAFGVDSLSFLREQLQREHGPYLAHLSDFRLRAFVDRAASDFSDGKWLDSIASLATGRRIEAWGAETLDQFSFEIRALARQLTRWLVIAQATEGVPVALKSPLASIHIVDVGGREEALLIRTSRSRATTERMAKVRTLLGDRADARDILGQLLLEYVNEEKKQERIAND